MAVAAAAARTGMVAASAYAETASGKLAKGGGSTAAAEAREPVFIMDPEEEVVTFRWAVAVTGRLSSGRACERPRLP